MPEYNKRGKSKQQWSGEEKTVEAKKDPQKRQVSG